MKHGKVRSARPTARRRAPAATRAHRGRRASGGFPIVGIGASAGGLDAFKRFFSRLPTDSGMAFVLIQHLDPTRESLTAELVGASTRMSVVQVQDGMRVEVNRVYVIPPNAYLSLRAGTLRLSAPTAPRSLRMAVDFFLRSLAEDQRENAIGIVLAGAGTDGTLGLQEIKAAGGMTMVQDPGSVQHDGMPRSAIAAAAADYILPADRMGDALLAHVRHAAVAAPGAAPRPAQAPDPLAAAVQVLRQRTRVDFSGYKRSMLQRRLQRRMGLGHLTDLGQYVERLHEDPAEAAALCRDLLVSVTQFFRDPEAWQVLQERVIRPMVAAKAVGASLRAWTPACASGEEAYSLAMVLIEEIEAAGKACRVQLFASDVDGAALEKARVGLYPEGIAAQMSAQRLARFFVKGEEGYQVTKGLRDAVVFAQQSLIDDPPFSRLDVVTCRNLFIYLEPALQERLVPLLHFALLDGGCLFLGSAEDVGGQADLFEPVSSGWRLYRRVGPTRHGRLQFPRAPAAVSTAARDRPASPPPPRLATLAPHLLLQRFAPACVIINRAREILYLHGRTDDYLAQPGGLPTRDLVAQARPGLRAPLRAAIQGALRERRRVVVRAAQVHRGNAAPRVTVSVEPLAAPHTAGDDLWLVSLEDDTPSASPADVDSAAPAGPGDTAAVQQLEDELRSTREDLQQTVEDVRAANEELMSVNEEFQSSNEELETSKEELQSLNEELTTANLQLAGKIGELEASTNDLDNLLTSSNIATLILDTQLCLRRFTPAATRLFRLTPSDIGRPLGGLEPLFTDSRLLPDAAAVLEGPTTPQMEVQTRDGRWYVRQVLPYRTRDERTEGVVITFSDVAADALQRQSELAHALRISTIGELASGLAHELNQPLSAIANGVEACARYVRAGTTRSADLLALLDDASAEALRAGSIVEHLRHFIEKGQPQFESTDLCEIARNIPRLLGRELRGAQVTLRIDVASRPLPIHADRIQIEQVIVNLMQNAIDAIREAPHDGAEIQLQVWAAKGMAELAVRDTGSGASAAATERMFEPFFSTKPHGLGMGLAISRSIIEAHLGRIWVKRRADGTRGTTVRFTLPRLAIARAGRKRSAA